MRLAPPVLESDRAEGEITEADDAGAKHQQPKQTIFKNAGEAPGGRWRTHYIAAKGHPFRCAHCQGWINR
jgi:hypothetical protein